MKKILLGVLIAAIGVVALGTAGVVNAQSDTPQATSSELGYGAGMMYGRGNRSGMSENPARSGLQDGFLHNELIEFFADKLGISTDTLDSRLSDGETLSQVVLAEGFTLEDFRSWMTEARAQALAQAVADGTLTQDQADWMSQRGSTRGAGIRGNGAGSAECPYYPSAQ